LRDDPDEIVAAHRTFSAAAPEVAITASYQVSFERLGAETCMRCQSDTRQSGPHLCQ
jgi:S-methylmethionine-dependent homocysteine/selenocysteine methylase